MYTPDYFAIFLNFLLPLVPFLIGLFRWKKMDPVFHPFIIVLGSAFLVEIFRGFQLMDYYNKWNLGIGISLIGYNLYVLVISILFAKFFHNIGQLRLFPKMFHLLIAIFILLWVFDHFILPGNDIHYPTKVFRLFYSFVLCILSIQHINTLLIQERGLLLKNSSFLICLGILIFFIPYIITEGIFLFLGKSSPSFLQSVYNMRKITIILMNLIFLLAVLWIPQKKRFIQLS
jgi:hypothetical protein